MPPTETTKEGQRTITLRLSMLRPDGRPVDYDELVKNSKESYDAACQKLSDREREKIAEGWDRAGRFIVEMEDKGTDIETRILRGKEWDFIGEPGKPPMKNGQVSPVEEKSSSQNENLIPAASGKRPQITEVSGDSDPAEAFLEALGELCLKHRIVLTGDALRLEGFTMKAFRRLLAVEQEQP